MLFYEPPFLMVDDIVVYPDHADRRAFYWLKGVPELVRASDGEPAFWSSVFLPSVAVTDARADAVTRVTVSFDTELRLSAESEERVREEIRRRWQRPPRVLSPVPLSAGTTSLILATPEATGDANDVFVHTGHPPSLVAENRAAFVLAAEGIEARILAAALLESQPAAVVSYSLEYPGLAPSFKARLHVDWRAAYRRFRERDATNFIFVSEEVEDTLESFEEGREITVEVEELSPDGASAATKALMDQLREQVLERFFEAPVQLGDVPVEERIAAGIRDIGSSLLPGKHHLLRRVEESALSATTIDLSEERVRTYTFHVQSTLAGLLAGVEDLRERVVFVDLGALPHRRESVRLELAAGAETFAVRLAQVMVNVSAEESAEPVLDTTVILRPGEPPEELAYRRPGTSEPTLRYGVTIHLDPERSPSGRETVEFEPRVLVGDRIWIHPEEWLDLKTLRIVLDDPNVFEPPTGVEVEVETVPVAPGVEPHRARLELSATKLEARHTVVVDEGAEPRFRLREIFRRQGEPDFVRGPHEVGPGTHRVMNPFANSWTLRVTAMADWGTTRELFAEFRLWDVERELFLRDEHAFSQDEASFVLAFSTSPATPRHRAEARLTRLGLDGTLIRGPWLDLAGPVAVLNENVEPVRRLRAILVAPTFADLDLRKVWVELQYEDPQNGLDLEQDLVFEADGAVEDWTHPFPDPTRERYRYRLRARSRSGSRWSAEWTQTALDTLRLRLPDDPFDE